MLASSNAVDNIEASAVSSGFVDQSSNLERQSAKPLVFPGPQGATMVQARLREEEIPRSMMQPAGRAAFSSQDGSHCTSWFCEILQVPSITGCIGTGSTKHCLATDSAFPVGQMQALDLRACKIATLSVHNFHRGELHQPNSRSHV